jgi:uncharacterized damage-inducible protein DinB
MKAQNSLQLLAELRQTARQVLQTVEQDIAPLPDAQLLTAPGPGRWHLAQVLEHLNAYSRYYLPRISETIRKSTLEKELPAAEFKAGWLGDYFTRSMLPKQGVVANKMQTMKDYNPVAELPARQVVWEFLEHQRTLISLLQQAEKVNLNRWRIPITITKLIKLKLGDVFRFLIAHEARHLVQLQQTLAEEK